MTRTGKGVSLRRHPVQFTELRHADQSIVGDALPRSDRAIMDQCSYGIPAICGFCGRAYDVKRATVLTMLAIGHVGNPRIAPMVRSLMSSRLSGLTLESVAIECTCGMQTSFGELRPHVSRYVGNPTGPRQKIGDR